METHNNPFLVFFFCLGIISLFSLIISLSRLKLGKKESKKQNDRLIDQENLLYSTILNQEEEKERIAKGLHDEIGSKLNIIYLYLNRFVKMVPEAQEGIADLTEVLNDTIKTTRQISHDLLPATLDTFGLAVAIEELCEHFQQTTLQIISLEIIGDRPSGINKLVELNLFRVLWELFENAKNSSKVEQIEVKLDQCSERIILEYSDNKPIFDFEENLKDLGMKNIQSRIKMIGGIYTLKSGEEKGIEVKIEVSIGENKNKPTKGIKKREKIDAFWADIPIDEISNVK